MSSVVMNNESEHQCKRRRKSGDRPKKQKSLEETFKQLNRDYVKIKKRDRKCNNVILYSVLQELLKIMQKQNSLFRRMKPKLEYLGSYFDGLRVGQPTEFDINVVLKLPVDYSKIYLDSSNTCYDYTYVYMSSEFRRLSSIPATANEGYEETKMWCDKEYRLSVKKFRSWMQKVVDSALAMLPTIRGKRVLIINKTQYRLASKTSGPASTITISTGNCDNIIIDVDLVPTFAFKLPKYPVDSQVLFQKVESAKAGKTYFIVPKPSDDDFSWRLAFPFQERSYLTSKNNLKSTVKLLKLLRDAQEFKQLASYYIKTIFLWEADKNNANEFWKRNSLSFLVLFMLKKLKCCLDRGEINNFWCPESNLIRGKIKSETCRNWSNRLAVIIKNIEQNGKSNPDIVVQYFSLKNNKQE